MIPTWILGPLWYTFWEVKMVSLVPWVRAEASSPLMWLTQHSLTSPHRSRSAHLLLHTLVRCGTDWISHFPRGSQPDNQWRCESTFPSPHHVFSSKPILSLPARELSLQGLGAQGRQKPGVGDCYIQCVEESACAGIQLDCSWMPVEN